MSRQTDWRAILDIADRLEPEARRGFLAAVLKLRDEIDVAAIIPAVGRGQPVVAAGLVDASVIRRELDPLVGVSQRAMLTAGEGAAKEISDPVATLGVGMTNPHE